MITTIFNFADWGLQAPACGHLFINQVYDNIYGGTLIYDNPHPVKVINGAVIVSLAPNSYAFEFQISNPQRNVLSGYITLPANIDNTTVNAYQFVVSGSIPNPPNFTASYAISALFSNTASYAVTASYALNGGGGGGSNFPDITDNTGDHYIGINQTNPEFTLDVNGFIGNSSGDLNLASMNGNIILRPYSVTTVNVIEIDPTCNISDGNGNYYIGANNANTYFNVLGGNVGIGTDSPNFTLDVAGDINFTGTLRQNGSPFSSGGTQVYIGSNANPNSHIIPTITGSAAIYYQDGGFSLWVWSVINQNWYAIIN